MNKQTESSRFIVPSMPAFYQHLLSGIVTYQELGNRIINQIKAAHAFRQTDKVRELSKILINIPIKEYQLIARYYLVWCECRAYKFDNEALEIIIEQSRTYKTQALLSRGTFDVYQGKVETSFYFYTEALKTVPSTSEYIGVSLAISVAKAIEGFHHLALRDMEKLVPLIKYAEPRLYYDFLNSYAVELGESGRIYEARNICDAVLASPFAFAYPNWHQTAQDLRGANRSIVAVNRSRAATAKRAPAKVLPMPAREAGFTAPDTDIQTARILSFEEWKIKMVKDKEDDGENEPISLKDMFLKIMNVYTNDTTTDEQRYKIYEAVMKVMREPKPKPPDEPPPPDDPQGA